MTKADVYAQYLCSLRLSELNFSHLSLNKLTELAGTLNAPAYEDVKYFVFDDGSHAVIEKCFPFLIRVIWNVSDHPIA